jgi:hypothetical protein
MGCPLLTKQYNEELALNNHEELLEKPSLS